MKTAVSAERWNWLFAPARADLGFAVRTACAAILSLLIAMWMELGSPQWAPLTVWTVATASRGESFSKARWRLAGTVVGCGVGVALIAAFPQEAGLFFLCLALWTGVCCGLATAFDGYRSYGFLVASFTAAIVATDGIASPGDAFFIAMARGTYIALGILCEAALFSARRRWPCCFRPACASGRGGHCWRGCAACPPWPGRGWRTGMRPSPARRPKAPCWQIS
ncbi:FUSC family protein [Gluconacetobacter dulcium]|uniref:FUSC family protein n=1 Tax=Gluconacetobacter dulcium TaxID=2729096 RepID=UPI00287B9C21|nr:FUSC family protein [Gluconacetobacter dulcium]